MIPLQSLGTQAFIQRPELTRCCDGLVTLTHSKITWEGRLDLRIIWIRLACGNICGAVLTALTSVGRPSVRVRGAISWVWTLGYTEVEKLGSAAGSCSSVHSLLLPVDMT